MNKIRIAFFHRGIPNFEKARGQICKYFKGIRNCKTRSLFVNVKAMKWRYTFDWADIVVLVGWTWNIPIYLRCMEKGKPFLCMADGYINRSNHFSIRSGGIHAYSKQSYNPKCSSDRWDNLGVKLAQWRTKGNHIVIAHQHLENYWYTLQFRGYDRQQYYKEMVDASLKTGRKVIICKHNADEAYKNNRTLKKLISGFARKGCEISKYGSLRKHLKGAHCLLTFDSNSATDAVIRGVPAIVWGGKTMADEVCSHNLGDVQDPPLFDRAQWCNWIAYQQWSFSELRKGLFWSHLKHEVTNK